MIYAPLTPSLTPCGSSIPRPPDSGLSSCAGLQVPWLGVAILLLCSFCTHWLETPTHTPELSTALAGRGL